MVSFDACNDMTTDIKRYLNSTYPNPPCWALVADYYVNELKYIIDVNEGSPRTVQEISTQFTLELHKGKHGFIKVQLPSENCVVLMGKNQRLNLHHCGVYVDGRVLHATSSGVFWQDLSSIKDMYSLLEFWEKPKI